MDQEQEEGGNFEKGNEIQRIARRNYYVKNIAFSINIFINMVISNK